MKWFLVREVRTILKLFFCNANSSKEKINIRLIFYSFDRDTRHLRSIWWRKEFVTTSVIWRHVRRRGVSGYNKKPNDVISRGWFRIESPFFLPFFNKAALGFNCSLPSNSDKKPSAEVSMFVFLRRARGILILSFLFLCFVIKISRLKGKKDEKFHYWNFIIEKHLRWIRFRITNNKLLNTLLERTDIL